MGVNKMEQVYVAALSIRLFALLYWLTLLLKSSDKTRSDFFRIGIATFIMALCCGICMSYNLMKASDSWIMNLLTMIIWSGLSINSFYEAAFSPDSSNTINNIPPTITKNNPPPPIILPKQNEQND